jgi:hypothetical protein
MDPDNQTPINPISTPGSTPELNPVPNPKTNWRFLIAVPVVFLIVIFALFYLGFFVFPSTDEVWEANNDIERENQTPYWANLREYRSSLSTISSTSTTADPDWMLYRNEEYGFEVEVPTGWDIIKEFETLTEVEFGSIPAGSFRVSFSPSPHDFFLDVIATSGQFDDLIFEENDQIKTDEDYRSVEMMNISGLPSRKTTFWQSYLKYNYYQYKIITDQYIFFVHGPNEETKDEKNIYNHILKSFKTFNPQFRPDEVIALIADITKPRSYIKIPLSDNVVISSTDNPDWSLYRNNKAGLQFEYPSDWATVSRAFEDDILESDFYSKFGTEENNPSIFVQVISESDPLEIYRRDEELDSKLNQAINKQVKDNDPLFNIDSEGWELNNKYVQKYTIESSVVEYEYRLNNNGYVVFITITVPVDIFDIGLRFQQTLKLFDPQPLQ